MPISDEDRYSRQVLFAPIGPEGQQRLRQSRAVVVGCGATGSVIASLLARAGVGTLRIVDRDYVEASNLQRQMLFDEQDAAESVPKAVAAERKLASFNSDVRVEAEIADLTPATAERLLSGFDLIMDGTDNFETRYLINDFAVQSGIPWIYTAAVGSYGVTLNVVPGRTSCLTCVFPEAPRALLATCDTAGIVNSAASAIASIAATEAIKVLTGSTDALRSTLLSLDVWQNQRAELKTANPRIDCQTCRLREFHHLDGACHPQVTMCGRNSVQIHERERPVDFAELEARLRAHGRVRHNEFVLKFWRAPYELTLFGDGRAIIKGTTDQGVARSLYARFIGS